MSYEDRRDYAVACDERDPLGTWRDEFNFPVHRNGYAPLYFCGNSLGLQPKLAVKYVRQELDRWHNLAVDGHFHAPGPWVSYHRQATRGFAELAGAKTSEVVAMNTLTVNLHLLMASFYRPSRSRYKIIIESQAFPSDRYAAASQLRLHGFDPVDGLIEWRPAAGSSELCIDDLSALLDEHGDQVALLLLPGVQYYSGQVLDMAAIAALGRHAGCIVGLDLAHAIGNIKLALNDWGPDFAAWCTYKYLNSGPGAVAGIFVHERHHSNVTIDQLQGWWGHDEATRFNMANTFTAAAGAERWQMSNPPIFSLAPVVASLEVFHQAGLERLIEKSSRLTGYLAWLIERRFAGRIESITPADCRGCQLSLVVRESTTTARALFEALCARNVTGDWREPDVIRVAPVPLYNSYADVFDFADRLADVLDAVSP